MRIPELGLCSKNYYNFQWSHLNCRCIKHSIYTKMLGKKQKSNHISKELNSFLHLFKGCILQIVPGLEIEQCLASEMAAVYKAYTSFSTNIEVHTRHAYDTMNAFSFTLTEREIAIIFMDIIRKCFEVFIL